MKNQILLIPITLVLLLFSQCKKLSKEVECMSPGNILQKELNNNSITISWDIAESASQYLLEYRKQGDPTFTVIRVTSGTSTQVKNLAAGTTYEYRMQANCPSSNSKYSEIKQFKTLTNNEVYIIKKWRILFYKENNVQLFLGQDDYLDFMSDNNLKQSLTVGGTSVVNSGTWAFNSSIDSVQLNLNTVKKWKIQKLDEENLLLIKNAPAPLTTVDSVSAKKF